MKTGYWRRQLSYFVCPAYFTKRGAFLPFPCWDWCSRHRLCTLSSKTVAQNELIIICHSYLWIFFHLFLPPHHSDFYSGVMTILERWRSSGCAWGRIYGTTSGQIFYPGIVGKAITTFFFTAEADGRETQYPTAGFSVSSILGKTAEQWPISLPYNVAGLLPEKITDILCPSTSKQLWIKLKVFLSIIMSDFYSLRIQIRITVKWVPKI